jgi:peptidoglycan/xylan/chitin deacetylase (PgdA/CDA1 family)
MAKPASVRAVDRLVRKSRLAFQVNQWRLRRQAGRGVPSGSVRAVAGGERLIALSYDDGPSPANTPELLQILASAGARATFFVVGTQVERHPELAEQIVAAGHELGNHTYSHVNPRDLDEQAFRREVERGAEVIAGAAGPSRLFRPPFGKRSALAARICASLGLTNVLWSVDSGDTMPFDAARIAREVVERAEPGDIVLMHDGGDRRQRTLDATREVLSTLVARGYRFVTVSELIDGRGRSVPRS